MAYSNWGAYVWKNGVLMPNLSDNSLVFKDNEWKITTKEDNEELYNEGENYKNKMVGSHAMIPLGRFCLEFYKVYLPKIHFESAEIQITSEDKTYLDYKNEELNLNISGRSISMNENIFEYRITNGQDYYFVVIGSAIGSGFDDDAFSKYLKKNVVFNKDDKSYIIKEPTALTIYDITNKYDRIREIKYQKGWIKSYLKDLIKPKNYKNFRRYFNDIKEGFESIYWLS